MANTVLILIREGPYGTFFAGEAFRFGISCSTMELEAKIVLIEDGVYAAVKGQSPGEIHMHSLEDAFGNIGEFGLKLYIHSESLEKRGISRDRVVSTEIINNEKLSELVDKSDVVAIF